MCKNEMCWTGASGCVGQEQLETSAMLAFERTPGNGHQNKQT